MGGQHAPDREAVGIDQAREPCKERWRSAGLLNKRDSTSVGLQFIHQRLKQVGEISPPNTIVIHPFGRYCNANKFAGEIDRCVTLTVANSLLVRAASCS